MARKICNHPVFPSLRAKLTALKITVCPTCLIRLHIFEIAETQAALERRGGIFASRAAADHDTVGRGQERVCHRALVRRWRVAKIDLYRDLCRLDTLRAEGAGKTRWELQLVKAFDLWREVEIECSRIPGYKYSEDDFSDVVDGEDPGFEPEDDFDYRLNEETLDQATAEEDKGWETVKSKSRSSRQPPNDEAPLAHPPAVYGEDINMSDTTDIGADLDMRDPDEVVLQEMEAVTSRLESDSNCDGRDRYNLLEEIGVERHPTFHGIVDNDTSSKRRGRAKNVATTVAPAVPLKAPTQSLLKRTTSRRFKSRSPSHNYVRINNLATVFCDPNDRQGLPSNCNSIVRPHFSYTDSDSARRRLSFNRKSSFYEAMTWAAPQDYENINTSHYTVAWNDYEAWQNLCDDQERNWTENEDLERAPRLTDADDESDGASCAEIPFEKQKSDGAEEGSCEEMNSESSSDDIEKVFADTELEDHPIVPPIAEPCSLPDAQSSKLESSH